MTSIDQKIARASNGLPPFLQRKIKFVEALGEDVSGRNTVGYKRSAQTESSQNTLKAAKTTLFDKALVKNNWNKVYHIGPGLANLGNTCFLNSVLQSLLYTAPFSNILLNRIHGKGCKVEGFCIVCEMERLVQAVFSNQHRRHISPNGVVANIKLIGKQFRLGRQEDAHEFLRYFIEGMQKVCLTGLDPKMDNRIKETSLVHSIFGGYLQSKVTCHTCKHESCVFEPLLDLSLEVRNTQSVQQALRQFTAAELLSKGNRYRCESCNKLTDASKQFRVQEAPNVLTVHLKRFQMLPQGMIKINRDIEFSCEFDLTPFMSSSKSNPALYDLYSVLVHEGQSCSSGHYHCFVKNSNGIWYSMNDESVHQVSLATVLKQKAYILFYQKRITSPAKAQEEPVLAVKRQKSFEKPADTRPQAPIAAEIQKEVPKGSPRKEKKPKAEQEVPSASQAPSPVPSSVSQMSVDDDLSVENIISKSMWHLKKFISNYGPSSARVFPAWKVTSAVKKDKKHRL